MMIPSLIILIVTVACVGFYRDRQQRIEFRMKFPPLTDEEFVQRCGPGTNPEVALKVRDIISSSLGIEPEEIYPEHRFVDDLDAG